ncbi:MAG: hypothetical protein JW976_12095 [Syntrophaceae bacterium]|nr:hypothetical protein [Syntrophaceae bacterium]
MHLTIISDDLTGAVDSSAFALASDSIVRVETAYYNTILPHEENETISINVSSRTLSGSDSKARHKQVAEKVSAFPDQIVMKKMDTGFRGNAPYEIEGIMEGLGNNVCFLIDHSPNRGTFTLYGNQYVEGVYLPKSIFANEDPLKRPDSAYIPDILAKEATVPVGLVDIDSVKGTDLLGDVKKIIEKSFKIIVFDAINNEDTRKIVHTLAPIYPHALWAGSSGIAWGLAEYIYGEPAASVYQPQDGLHCVCFTASAYSKVQIQIAKAEKLGLHKIIMDMDRIVDGDENAIQEAIDSCLIANKTCNFILTPYLTPGHKCLNISDLIMKSVTRCAKEICSKAEFERVVVIGGETSYSILAALGAMKLHVIEKPETGIGTGSIDIGPYKGKTFSIKGGSIGTELALCRMLGIPDEKSKAV